MRVSGWIGGKAELQDELLSWERGDVWSSCALLDIEDGRLNSVTQAVSLQLTHDTTWKVAVNLDTY
jgi:hypothetical protein